MSGAPIKRIKPEEIRSVRYTLRKNMATYVQDIYKNLWKMSDTKFCKYMGKEIDMSAEGVRLFLHRQCMEKGLMEPGRLSEILEEIFARYIADERVDLANREEAQKAWDQQKEQQLEKINETARLYFLTNKVGSLRAKDYDAMSNFPKDISLFIEIHQYLQLLLEFVTEKWPEDPKQGLSYEEIMKLRYALFAYGISDKHLKDMRKKYKDYF